MTDAGIRTLTASEMFALDLNATALAEESACSAYWLSGAPHCIMDDLRGELDTYGRPVDGQTRWVMGRAAYDRLRAALVTEDQERARAQAHASAWISVFSHSCPACPSGPFDTPAGVSAHMVSMADVTNREPHDGDMMLGIRIEVREDAGKPGLRQLTA